MNFEDYTTVQQVLNAYKKWFLKEARVPSFMLEPISQQQQQQQHFPFSSTSSLSTIQTQSNDLESPGFLSSIDEDKCSITTANNSEFMTSSSSTINLNENKFQRATSLSSSVYSSVSNGGGYLQLGHANFAENLTRIGYVKCLQIFLFHSSNLLLNRSNLQREKIKNVCCYTLEIYMLFIRKPKMYSQTWLVDL